jgi:gibberellin receptor GID1
VVCVYNCRRAPEHRFPVAYDDSYSVLEWLESGKANANLPVDLSRVFLAGDSAGGNIVHHIAIRASGKSLGRLTLRGLVLIQPFFGGEERTPVEVRETNPLIVSQELLDWFWKAYLPPDANRDHPACNVFGPRSEDISNVSVPPVIMFVGGRDILQDWQVREFCNRSLAYLDCTS